MHYRTLGRTGLKVSLLSHGSGGPSRLGQRTGASQDQQIALIRECLDYGINLFDTSAQYGESEAILGRALKGLPRDAYFLCTKWGHERGGELSGNPSELTTSLDRSLRRLGTDHVDVMLFHGLMQHQYRHVMDVLYPEMTRLRDAGKIRFVGFSEMFRQDPKHETVSMALRSDAHLWDVIMLKYGILNQWAAKDALPLAREHQVGIMNMAPVRLKLTSRGQVEETVAGWKKSGFIGPDDLPDENPFGWLVRDGVESVISAGYKFAAHHEAISTVFTGTSSIDHLKQNVAALEEPLLREEDTERLVRLLGDTAETS